MKAAAEAAAIVGASPEAGEQERQLTQPTRAPKGVAEKEHRRGSQKKRPQSSQKEHPLEQPRPLEQLKSRRSRSHDEQPQEQGSSSDQENWS